MAREQQAGRARGLRGKTETAGRKRRLDLDLGKRRDQRATLQPFFQSPGRVVFIPGHHHERKSGVEAGGDETRSIGASPFKRGLLGEAPQQEIPAHPLRRRLFGDDGKGESKRGRLIAISFRLDLVKSASFEFAKGAIPPSLEARRESTTQDDERYDRRIRGQARQSRRGEKKKESRRGGEGPCPVRGGWPETREPARAREFARVNAQSGPSPLPRLLLQRQPAERGDLLHRLERRYARLLTSTLVPVLF